MQDLMEEARLNNLRLSNLLDKPSSKYLNTILEIGKLVFDVNILTVTLVDRHRQWFKAKIGLEVEETPRDISFCTHTIQQNEPMVINDAEQNPLFKNNPLVTGYPHIRFYSGVPIRSASGYKLGSFCLIDDKPRHLSAKELALQKKLALLVERELIALSKKSFEDLPSSDQINQSLVKAQNLFLETNDEKLTFETLLDELLSLTESTFGYIGGIHQSDATGDAHTYLKMKSITNISWDKHTAKMYNDQHADGLEFHNLDNLLGVPLQTGKSVITNAFKTDPRLKGLPQGHPDINNYCAIPINSNNTCIGVIGLANRAKGYSDEFIEAIEPIVLTVSVLMERDRMLKDKETYTQKLFNAAHIDDVTQLPNRRSLSEFVNSLLKPANADLPFSLCFFDLDGFKTINDTYGHQEGDNILSAVGKRLMQTTRKFDFIARISGDEFVVVLPNATPECFDRILKCINANYSLNNDIVKLSASMGVASYPKDGQDLDQLMRHADQAMYVAKQSGKNKFVKFDVDLHHSQKQKNEQIAVILAALNSNEFVTYFQPQLRLADRKVVGFELLSRWHHPQRGVLKPNCFLDDIRETQAQVTFDNYIFKKVIGTISELHKVDSSLSLNVNVSPAFFKSTEFVKEIEALATVRPDIVQSLVIEIVESATLGDLDNAIERLRYCRKLGFRISLDDFGTSFSSLTYFRSLPVDEVKIDRSFVADILDDRQDLAIVKAIIDMTFAFSRTIVAEGVETEEQAALLADIGCQVAQGYLFAKPMPLIDALTYCRSQNASCSSSAIN